MRIPSGKTDQAIYFVAVDPLTQAEKTGLSGFTVYRSRNGGAAVAMISPTVAEISAAHMPGVYSLLVSEDTTIASTSDSEEMALYITQASMSPVTLSFELYRRAVTGGKTALVDDSGRVDVAAVAGTAQTAKDLGASATQTGDSFARLGAPAGASVSADVDAVAVAIGTITQTDASTLLDVANGVETGWTVRQALRVMLSVLAGKVTGLTDTTVAFRNITDTKTRLTATMAANGDRSAVTTDVS